MNDNEIVTILIEHYKNNIEDAEIVFEDICTSDEDHVFNLPDREVILDINQKNEFIKRYAEEIAPLIHDYNRLK